MVTCEDILRLRLDGVSLVAGENGLDRMVSWTYMVQTTDYAEPGRKVGLSFGPEDIHVMWKMGVY